MAEQRLQKGAEMVTDLRAYDLIYTKCNFNLHNTAYMQQMHALKRNAKLGLR